MIIKRLLPLYFLIITIGTTQSQTLVKMVMPDQPAEKLQVVRLFDEFIPLETSVILGSIGFQISGGTEPYKFNWLKDNMVFATGDIAVFIPEAGKRYAFQVIDKNNCMSKADISLETISRESSFRELNIYQKDIILTPTYVTDQIKITFTRDPYATGKVRIFDLHGRQLLYDEISGSTSIPVQLPSGVYLVLIESSGEFVTYQIVVNH